MALLCTSARLRTHRILHISAALVILGAARAQSVTAAWTATTDLHAAAIGTDGLRSARIPATTRIGNASLGAVRSNARALSSFQERLVNGKYSFQVTEFADASGTSTNAYAGQTGAHMTRIHLTSPTPVRAVVSIDMTAWGSGSAASQAWDYNAALRLDQQLLFSVTKADGRPSLRIPVLIGPNGTTIETLTGALAASSGGLARSNLTVILGVSFETRCTEVAYGVSCAGLLTMHQNFDGSVDLALATGNLPFTRGFGLVGIQRQSILIPGTQCFLSTDLHLVLAFTTDFIGSARFPSLVPPAFAGRFTAQVALFPGTSIGTTNGLEVTCK